jgi:PTH1 family peptidyl-tRNA hydrolase
VKLVAGLGNPGPRYAGSRHNVGFMVVDALAARWRADVSRFDRDYEALTGEGSFAGQRVVLLKPQTFMNLSGRSVSAVLRFYKLDPADALVVVDDLDLPPGKLRVRASGSAGGHRGLEDVIRQLGGDGFPRLRIGIGKVHRSATVEHVLSRFDAAERAEMDAAVGRGAEAVECWLQKGIVEAMNQYNRRSDEPEKPPAARATDESPGHRAQRDKDQSRPPDSGKNAEGESR